MTVRDARGAATSASEDQHRIACAGITSHDAEERMGMAISTIVFRYITGMLLLFAHIYALHLIGTVRIQLPRWQAGDERLFEREKRHRQAIC